MRRSALRAPGLSAPRALAACLLLVLVGSAFPTSASLAATGVWIFPHAHASEAVGGSLSDAFYIADNSSDWLQDSFFADSRAGSASVRVDFYNPTSSDLSNLQVFAAVSDADLFTDISFAGGSGGEVTVVAADLSGGTPFLSDGSSMPAHDIYPAAFTSYGVGDLSPGSSGILTIWVNVTGDFSGGLIVHLDYTAEDPAGSVQTGPFEADMNIFENGESCTAAAFEVTQSTSVDEAAPGESFEWTISVRAGEGDLPEEFTLTQVQSWALTHEFGHALGPTHEVAQDELFEPTPSGWVNTTSPVGLSPLLLPGDRVTLNASVAWTDPCDGSAASVSAPDEATVTVAAAASGDVHRAGWWKDQFKDAAKGKEGAAFGAPELERLLQAVALHSGVFAWGPWDGTGPNGSEDAGWVDIGSLDDALKVLGSDGGGSGRSGRALREALALWLNVANGGVNLGSALEASEGSHEDDEDDDEDNEDDSSGQTPLEAHTGLSAPGDAYDTPLDVLAFAAGQLDDWSDGSGSSRGDLKLARNLCRSVNEGWLVAV